MKIVITGAEYSLGLTLCKVLLARGHLVWGTSINPGGARSLWELEAEYPTSFQLIGAELGEHPQPDTFITALPHCEVIFWNREAFLGLSHRMDTEEFHRRLSHCQDHISVKSPHLTHKIIGASGGEIPSEVMNQSSLTHALQFADELYHLNHSQGPSLEDSDISHNPW